MQGLMKEAPASSTGARKALSIGIQYREEYVKKDAPRKLESTHGDSEVIKKILTQFYGYKEEDIVVMKDDGVHTLPTRENILRAIDDLVRDAKAGDRFVFHFSGHGAQVPDESGDEEDNMDEVIWPVDIIYDQEIDEGVGNYILDDELRERLIDALPAGTYLTILLDCCHSGTGADLPEIRSDSDDEIDQMLHKLWSPISPKARSVAPFSHLSPTGAGKAPGRGPVKLTSQKRGSAMERLEDLIEKEIEEVRSRVSHEKHVTSWAACVDDTLELESADGGMLTMAFWTVLHNNQNWTHLELYKAIAEYLVNYARRGKKQVLEMGLSYPKPVLSSLTKLDRIHPLPFSF
ncbi:hypothetical protein ACEPAI_9967 [Sanghuangporus weigelae]